MPAAAAVKQLRKNHLPGEKHRASEGRASSKTTPKNCLPCHPVPKWENPRIAPKKSLTSLLKPIENDDFSYFCCCCACCGSSPKQDSKVLFPGALPLASAGVGGYESMFCFIVLYNNVCLYCAVVNSPNVALENI